MATHQPAGPEPWPVAPAVHNMLGTPVLGPVVQAGAIGGSVCIQDVPNQALIPRQLPPAPHSFTGRRHELALLTSMLASVENGTAPVAVIVGTGGIGKTWLATHWAHQCLDRFPDGQLFIDLRGLTTEKMTTECALRCLLDALGVAPQNIPVDFDAQVGRYRSLVSGKRMMILLDNAEDAGQVAPLLPGSSSCIVLITSRNRLDGLLASTGARRLTLTELGPAEARELFTARLGPQRVAAEPDVVAELISYCAGLPLALSIAAGRAAEHDAFPLARLATELHDAPTRLGAFDLGDSATSLATVLSWSYHALPEPDTTVFALLGLTSGPDIGLGAIASLSALSNSAVRSAMRGLERMSLVHEYILSLTP